MTEPQQYFFLLDFTAQGDAGLAIVIAQSSTAAVACLRQGGRYNGTPDSYHITTCKNVGKYYGKACGLMLETYTNAAVVYEAIVALLDQVMADAIIYPSDLLPLMDSIAEVGTETKYARGDHRHPSDSSKQDVIGDLAVIRSGAAKGATAYQKPSTGIPKSDLKQDVQSLLDSISSKYELPNGGIPANQLSEGVRESLGRADTALQEETDPTVPSWAKQDDKPNYSYSEITDTPDLSGFITKTVNDLVYYYTKSETYTKTEVQNLISAIHQFTYQLVDTLPAASESTMRIIYLVPSTDPQTRNIKNEYITLDNGSSASPRYTWEQIGSTAIDLDGYVTTAELNAVLADYTTTANLTTLLSAKQDTLVSGTNIKTINNESLLGSGNITIQGGGGDTSDCVKVTSQNFTSEQKAQARTNIGAGTYSKPSGGIPSTDLASGVIPTVNNATLTVKMNNASKGTFTANASSNVEIDLGTVITSHQDISGKADKVSSATSGHFAGLDGNGNLTDSGSKASDFLTQHQDISGKEDTSNKVSSWSSTTTDDHYPSEKLVKDSLDAKQATLVGSGIGQNIKTVNNNSLMGSGNVSVGTVTGVTVGTTAYTPTSGVVTIPAYPDAVEANPTVPSGTTPTNLTGLKVGSDYYGISGGGSGTVTDVTVGGTSVVDSSGVAVITSEAVTETTLATVATTGAYSDLSGTPDAIEPNPTVPSGTTSTALTGLKIGTSYYDIEAGGGTVTDVTVGGTSVVTGGVAAVEVLSTSDIDTIWATAMA